MGQRVVRGGLDRHDQPGPAAHEGGPRAAEAAGGLRDGYPTPDGTAIRDYVHVVDLAEAHVRALEYLEGGGETTVLNLGTGVGSSVLGVLGVAERAIGRPVP